MDTDENEHEFSAEDEIYEYRSKDAVKGTRDHHQVRDKKYFDRRNVGMNQSSSNKRSNNRHMRREISQDNQRIQYEDDIYEEDDDNDLMKNISLRKQIMDLTDVRSSEMEANRKMYQQNLRKNKQNRKRLELSTQNDGNTRRKVLSPRSKNFLNGNDFEFEMMQQADNEMILRPNREISKRGNIRPRPTSAPKERSISNDKIQHIAEINWSHGQPPGDNPQIYLDNLYTRNERVYNHNRGILQRNFERRFSNNEVNDIEASHRPKMQKSMSFDVSTCSAGYNYDDYEVTYDDMPQQYQQQNRFQPTSTSSIMKTNRKSFQRSNDFHHGLNSKGEIMKNLSPHNPQSQQSLISHQDLDWNIEYCDDPGILDIPNLPPGYEDFCDIYYNEGFDAIRGKSQQKGDTFDSLHVYRSGDSDDAEILPNSRDKMTISEKSASPRLQNEEMFHVEETDNQLENERKIKSSQVFCKISEEREDLTVDVECTAITLDSTKKGQNSIRNENMPKSNDKFMSYQKDEKTLRPESQFFNRGFWYHFKSSPEESSTNLSKQPLVPTDKDCEDQMKTGFNYSDVKSKKIVGENYVKENCIEMTNKKQQEEILKKRLLELKSEKGPNYCERCVKDISINFDTDDDNFKQNLHNQESLSTVKSMPVMGIRSCCAHSGCCCLHRNRICCSTFSASFPIHSDFPPNVTVNIQHKRKNSTILISSTCNSLNSIHRNELHQIDDELSSEDLQNSKGMKTKKQKNKNPQRVDIHAKEKRRDVDQLMKYAFGQYSSIKKETNDVEMKENLPNIYKDKQRKIRSKHKKKTTETKKKEIKKSKYAVDLQKSKNEVSDKKLLSIDQPCNKSPENSHSYSMYKMNQSVKPIKTESNKNKEQTNVISDEEKKTLLISNLLQKKLKKKRVLNSEADAELERQTASRNTKKINEKRGNKFSAAAKKNSQGEKVEVISDEDKKKSLIKGLLMKKLKKNEMQNKKNTSIANRQNEKQQASNSNLEKMTSLKLRTKTMNNQTAKSQENDMYDRKIRDIKHAKKNDYIEFKETSKNEEFGYVSDVENKSKLLSNLIRKKKQQRQIEELKIQSTCSKTTDQAERGKKSLNEKLLKAKNSRKENANNTKKQVKNENENITDYSSKINYTQRHKSRPEKNKDVNSNYQPRSLKEKKDFYSNKPLINTSIKQTNEDKSQNRKCINISQNMKREISDCDSTDYDSSDYDSYESLESDYSDESDHSSDYTSSNNDSGESTDHTIDESQSDNETETDEDSDFIEDDSKEEIITNEEESDEESDATNEDTENDEETDGSFTDESFADETEDSFSDSQSKYSMK